MTRWTPRRPSRCRLDTAVPLRSQAHTRVNITKATRRDMVQQRANEQITRWYVKDETLIAVYFKSDGFPTSNRTFNGTDSPWIPHPHNYHRKRTPTSNIQRASSPQSVAESSHIDIPCDIDSSSQSLLVYLSFFKV